MSKIFPLGLWLLCSWVVTSQALSADDEITRRATHFETEIRPVLVAKCIQCHGAVKQEGGLRLDSAQALLGGGESGSTLEAGLPDASLLVEALKYEGFEMPPSGQLSERTIAQFERWIAEGAVWPEHLAVLRPDSEAIAEEDRQWWSFQPVIKHQPPAVQRTDWPQNEIDHFVLARLEAENLTPALPADRSVLVRRLYFDLLGVPPTPDEIQRFVSDSSVQDLGDDTTGNPPQAWERLIDRLLDDPRYGEHWARHWLDLVRYSESDGWNQDAYRPEMWRYRDYVVDAFNSDKPYPDFVREQLAGDEFAGDDPQARIAAGFLRLGIYEYNQRDARGHWNDIMNEMTDVAGDVFLGLSMACARCHDHKFDPLPQRDYFKLRAFFEPVIWRDDLDGATAQQRRAYQWQLAKWEQATANIREQIDQIVEPYNLEKWHSTADKFPLDIQACFNKPVDQRTSWEEQMSYLVARQFLEEGGGPLKSAKKEDLARLDQLETQLAAWDELKPSPLPMVMTVSNHDGPITPTTLPDAPEQTAIEPGFLAVMSQTSLPDYRSTHAAPSPQTRANFVSTDASADRSDLKAKHSKKSLQRRMQLADWIGDPRNPLTTRVIVNRIWQQHFGEGIVATSNDFGRLGAPPSHPELLDWLAATFVEQGWSCKQLHKQILMSATWQQSSHHPRADEYELRDPGEKLLWRSRVRRLQAEQLRDAMLLASGELQTTVGGPSVDESQPRRGLYVKSFRNNLDTFLHSFDMANGLKSVAVRDATTTPTQALLLFNGEYGLQRAQRMAERIQSTGHQTPSELVHSAYLWTWGRSPSMSELERGMEFVGALANEPATTINPDRLIDFCHVLLNSNEFLYVE